eukprot:TRINITY_DN28099_c0_g1_i1.p1 TRINITY_DN28099_c0_g1~~TRINITY_DN28099_c0_g1_i1.p1  ORF type:complete len:287 (-),score=68.23 TRINITY_DN28099_c0_g1_i1:148-1008(-)
MGVHDDEFVNPGKISDTLRCAVCMEVFEDPIFCGGWPCQHTFCKGCLDAAMEQKQQCPTCREEVPEDYLQPNLTLRSLLDELEVYCTRRCGWTGRRDAAPAHKEVCPTARLEAVRRKLKERAERRKEVEAQKSAQAEELEAHDVDSRLREKDSRIKQLEERAAAQDDSLGDVVRRLEERDARIASLEAQLAEQDGRLEDMCLKLSLMELDVPPRPTPPPTPGCGSRPSSRPATAIGISSAGPGTGGYPSPYASPSRPTSARMMLQRPKLDSMPSLEEMIAGHAFDM